MQPVAFDLDGTVWNNPPGDFLDPRTILEAVPIPGVVRFIRDWTPLRPVIYVTGRDGELRTVIETRLESLGISGTVFLNGTWQGFEHLTRHKAEILKREQPLFFVGDHESDREAARLAGVPFCNAERLF